jgi:hypothetical protein
MIFIYLYELHPMRPPDFKNRKPNEIITKSQTFDSACFTYRGLSWLDYAKRHASVSALQYAALETRQAIEQLLFEELIMSVGGQLDRKDYDSCKGSSTKIAKIIKKLSPDYNKLAIFTQNIMSLIPNSPPLIIWEHSALLKYWGAVSNYLHWAGEPKETFESPHWFEQAVETVGCAATYLLDNMKSGSSGIMMPERMGPETRQAWEDFRAGKIDIHSVRERVGLLCQ